MDFHPGGFIAVAIVQFIHLDKSELGKNWVRCHPTDSIPQDWCSEVELGGLDFDVPSPGDIEHGWCIAGLWTAFGLDWTAVAGSLTTTLNTGYKNCYYHVFGLRKSENIIHFFPGPDLVSHMTIDVLLPVRLRGVGITFGSSFGSVQGHNCTRILWSSWANSAL